MTTDRDELHRRLVDRLNQLDDEGLGQLDQLLGESIFASHPADAGQDEPRLLSRRQLLAGLLAGGAALGTSNLATAWYAREQGIVVGRQAGAEAARAQMMAESSPTWHQMQAEIDALRGLVAHYEALESIDLDGAVAGSIERFEAVIASLRAVSRPVVDGIDAVRAGLERFEAAVPAIRQGIAHVDDALNALDERLDALRQVLAEIVERAEPIAEGLGAFFDTVLERIPFGVGERIEMVVQRLRQLIEAVPATVVAVRERLLGPLQTTWFADPDEDGVEAGLLAPIRTRLLDPTEQLMSSLDDVAANWQHEVVEPARQALAQREAARKALAAYRQRHGL
ncbi:MAG: hypothetical protein D6791_14470 [Chloroflexi bacterium]|nr:MAG: hypothetical protein D6791_14470 [Chloroflexota bacterium]